MLQNAILAISAVMAMGPEINMSADLSADLSADTAQYVTALRDVEIVGVKASPAENLELNTTLDRRQIERYDITDIRGVSDIVPNVFMPAYGTRMTSSIYVRGLGARIDQPVVGLNVDNVPILNKDMYDLSLADLSHIDVIRGSAGVLNGRNAMGGQINVTTMSPWDFDGWRMTADFSRANTASVSASWYGKITPTLATSLVARIGTTDGFYKNTYYPPSDPAEHDFKDACGQERQASARWKLSWHQGHRWSLSNTAALSWSRQDGIPYASVETGKVCYNDSMFYQRLMFTDGLTISYTGKRMIATSVTSVQYLDDNMTLDQDFSPESMFTLTQKRHEWAVTEDLFAKGTRGRYSWLTGVFGFIKKTDMKAPVTFKDDGIRTLIEDNVNSRLPQGMELRWDERKMTLGSLFDINDGGFAVYHQSTIDLSPVTIQAGLRWDIEHVGLDYTSRCFTSCTMGRNMPTGAWMPLQKQEIDIDDTGHLSQTFNQLLPQLTIAWQPTASWLLRASVSKGYKAGGYNTQMFSDVLQQQLMEAVKVPAAYDIDEMLTYKPEKSLTYELTGGFTHARGNIEATLFWLSCRDQQLTVFPEGMTTGRAMTNAGRTRSLGVEVTGMWQATKELSFSSTYGFTHATFTRYNNGNTDLKGKRLPYAPAHTLFAAATYDFARKIGGIIKWSATVYTRGTGNIYWNDLNTESQKFYATLGTHITFHYDVARLTLFGENLTNTRYNTFYYESIGHKFVQHANPWTIGFTVGINLQRKRN